MIVRGEVEHTSHVYEAKSDMGAKQVAMRWAVDIVPPRSRGLFDEEHRDFQALFEPSVNIEVSDDISVVVSGTTEYEGEPIIAGEQGSVNDALLAVNAQGYNNAKMCYYDTVHSTRTYSTLPILVTMGRAMKLRSRQRSRRSSPRTTVRHLTTFLRQTMWEGEIKDESKMGNTPLPHRVQSDSEGWEGYVEVFSITMEEVNGRIESSSEHRFMAHNESDEDGNFEIAYAHKLSRWLGEDHGWSFPMADDDSETPACEVRETIVHGDLLPDRLPNVRSTSANNASGPQRWKVEAYTKVTPKNGIDGDPKEAHAIKIVDFP